MTYVEMVKENYGQNFENACAEIDTALNSLYTTINTIFNENTFPEEQTTRWTSLLSTASDKAAELRIKIDEKYGKMIEKAESYDQIVSDASAKAGVEVPTGEDKSSDQLTKHEYYSSIESAVAGMDTGEGYPIVFINNITIKKTRDTTDDAFGPGTKTIVTQSITVKTKAELYALPPFSSL